MYADDRPEQPGAAAPPGWPAGDFRPIFDQAPIGVLLADLAGRLVEVNPRFCGLTGYRREELIGLSLGALTHPDDQAADQRVAEELLEQRLPTATVVKRYLRKDGQVIWVRVTRNLLRDDAGDPRYGLAFVEDITAEQAALARLRSSNEALRRSEAVFAAAFKAGPIILTITRLADGRFIDVNDSFVTRMGYSRAEALGRTPVELGIWVDPELRSAGIAQLRRGRPVRDQVAALRTRHGAVIICLLSADLIDVDGEPCALTALTDMTAQERAARALRLLAEASGVLAASLDYEATLAAVAHLAVPALADWCLVHLRGPDGAARVAGYAHADPRHAELEPDLRRWYTLGADSRSHIALVLRTGRPFLAREISDAQLRAAAVDDAHLAALRRMQMGSGLIVPLLLRGECAGALTLIAGASGRRYDDDDLALAEELASRAAQAILHARLYADEQRARAEAEAAVRLRDEFLSVASHELNTPLTALLGTAQLMERRDARDGTLPERERQAVAMIGAQARRLGRFVATLLDGTRIAAGTLTLSLGPLDLAELVRRLADELRPITRHEIALALPPGPVLIQADALRLEQAIANLLQNAVKYSPGGGRIEVRLELGPAITLRVADEGIGIPAAALPMLFGRYYRAPNAAGRRIAGMGIGLYVVKEIVEQHGGRVDVASEEGAGSVFTLTLPAALLRAEPGAAAL